MICKPVIAAIYIFLDRSWCVTLFIFCFYRGTLRALIWATKQSRVPAPRPQTRLIPTFGRGRDFQLSGPQHGPNMLQSFLSGMLLFVIACSDGSRDTRFTLHSPSCVHKALSWILQLMAEDGDLAVVRPPCCPRKQPGKQLPLAVPSSKPW